MPVFVEKSERTAWVTLDRPPLNVLDLALLREIDQLLGSLSSETAPDFVVIRGGGERAFSAGVEIRDHTREKVPEMLRVVHGVVRKLLALPQITVALVRGACLGGGLELAGSCDFILASEESSFATPEINLGCYPPVALASFPSLLGYHRAAELILTGQKISAQEAAAMGLINRAVPAAELNRAVEALLEDLRSKSGAVLRITLKGLREIRLGNFTAGLARAEELYLTELLKTADVEEGVQAFLGKRRPEWKHR